eukprot:CAMPEP_0170567370 /NCGR_PEP_ID=MMETSP0211-20121228/80436_1 /TAXON_ID=311385 /ORGANISM="Pseudokeronopsis sp., Strain OXSARD2" /LENGTH=104 /DNA_ID=CAMNT_0010888805 /DNA_START=420 /DNA_END=734 /DNA_ORIENTATION=+
MVKKIENIQALSYNSGMQSPKKKALNQDIEQQMEEEKTGSSRQQESCPDTKDKKTLQVSFDSNIYGNGQMNVVKKSEARDRSQTKSAAAKGKKRSRLPMSYLKQ